MADAAWATETGQIEFAVPQSLTPNPHRLIIKHSILQRRVDSVGARLVALGASYIPALQAMNADPMVAMRYEWQSTALTEPSVGGANRGFENSVGVTCL